MRRKQGKRVVLAPMARAPQPRFVTRAREGEGFNELASAILEARDR